MTFDELPLYEAVYDVYRLVDNPRSDRWLTADSEVLCRSIQDHLPIGHPYTMPQMLDAWARFGKSGTVEGGAKKLELLVTIARLHGRKCFWADRGLGECTSEITIDRLLTGSRGGQYTQENCVLACSFHNSQRNDRSIEDYLSSAKDTP
jgi:hypothetical protein